MIVFLAINCLYFFVLLVNANQEAYFVIFTNNWQVALSNVIYQGIPCFGITDCPLHQYKIICPKCDIILSMRGASSYSCLSNYTDPVVYYMRHSHLHEFFILQLIFEIAKTLTTNSSL